MKHSITRPNTITYKMVEYVRANPGCSRAEIIAGIGYEGHPSAISNFLGRLRREKVLQNAGPYPKLMRWWVIDNKAIPMFREMAEDILEELSEIHPSVRVEHLAERLEALLGETLEDQSQTEGDI